MRARVVGVRRVHLDNRRIDNESNAKEQTSENLQRSPTERVDGHDADRSPHESDDGVDRLEQQRAACGYPDLRKDLRTEVLDSTNTSHLATRLDGHDQDGATEVRPTTEEV